MKFTMPPEPRLEVEKIPKLEEDMSMIRMMRTDPAWCSERLLC